MRIAVLGLGEAGSIYAAGFAATGAAVAVIGRTVVSTRARGSPSVHRQLPPPS